MPISTLIKERTSIMQKIKNIALYSILIFSMMTGTFSYAMEGIATKLGLEIVGEVMEDLAVAGPYARLAVKVCTIGQEIKSYSFPDEEEKAHAHEINEKYALLTTQNKFEKCLIKNNNSSERGPSGRPTPCEDLARMLIMLGGKNEVNKKTTIYNEYRKDQ